MSSSKEDTSAVRVLGRWSSPFVIRVLIALKLKGLEYEFVEETVGKRSELLLKSNPVHKKIPVLLHDGKAISESLIIVQYIDEVWASNGPAILPSDPYARATERFWAQYIDDKIRPAILVLRGTADGDKDEAAGQMSTALQHLEEAFVECSHGKHYFGGDEISYLDIAAGSQVGWIKAAEKMSGFRFLDETKVPNLAAWAGRISAHPAAKDSIPHADRLVEFSALLKSHAQSRTLRAPK